MTRLMFLIVGRGGFSVQNGAGCTITGHLTGSEIDVTYIHPTHFGAQNP